MFERGNKDLVTREGPRIDNQKYASKRCYPVKDQWNYFNHIVGFKFNTGDNYWGFDFIMSDGTRSARREYSNGGW